MRVGREMEQSERQRLIELLQGGRWVALGTLAADGAAEVSWVACCSEGALDGYLMHLSRLAAHTRNLLADPRASLAVSEPDDGRDDPQTLARVSLVGRVQVVARDTPAYDAARVRYLERFPAAEERFAFGDFALYRFRVEGVRLVAGFGKAFRVTPEQLRAMGGAGEGE